MNNNAALIEASLAHYADKTGDPYEAAFARLYAAHEDYERLFVLDTDEGLRRNMMRTTLEIIITYLDDKQAAANRITGARVSHIPYGIEDDFDLFFEIIRDVIAKGCAAIWTKNHSAAWESMLADFKVARL